MTYLGKIIATLYFSQTPLKVLLGENNLNKMNLRLTCWLVFQSIYSWQYHSYRGLNVMGVQQDKNSGNHVLLN